jgi:hypothetical protein
VRDRRGQFRVHRRHRAGGACQAFAFVSVDGNRRDLAAARPRRGLTGVAPGRGRGDRRIARGAGRKLHCPAGHRDGVGCEHDDVGVTAGLEHVVKMCDLADAARPSRVVRLQACRCEPAFDDGESARPGLRVVGQPHPRAGGRGCIECGKAGVERFVVGAERQQDYR